MITLILTSIITILLYIVINLYRKNALLYQEIVQLNSVEQDALVLIENLIITYTQVLSKLSRIDRLGSFESDDEVGFVFKTIKNTIEQLKNEMINLQNQISESEEREYRDNAGQNN